MAVRKIEHVGIMVSSIEQSIAFYEQVVGLQHLETIGHIDAQIRLAFLAFPGHSDTEIELVQGYSDQLPQEGRVHHVAFSVDDVEEEFARIRGLEPKGLDAEITTLPNGSRYFFFDGPDGERLEFFQSTR
ncbi:VOC family protein [Paenibacillus hunanensis]|uniref:VOC family protein n=1 Tax=Paenibacillus hunanensis TaxID=539262 RepID=UPI002A69EF9D|nr:VOC family protein [Paenibacillus hunanensis]WPP40266.1 VOC family protein [Paenibacillus hunanensis]